MDGFVSRRFCRRQEEGILWCTVHDIEATEQVVTEIVTAETVTEIVTEVRSVLKLYLMQTFFSDKVHYTISLSEESQSAENFARRRNFVRRNILSAAI